MMGESRTPYQQTIPSLHLTTALVELIHLLMEAALFMGRLQRCKFQEYYGQWP